MKTRIIVLVGIVLATTLSCRFTSLEKLITETPETITEERLYEDDSYSFTIPKGWGLSLTGGEYFDLGIEKKLTIHNAPLTQDSSAFFTVAYSPLKNGQTMEEIFDLAYQKGPDIENASKNKFELNEISGIELTYRRPWGEPWWQFRDIWLEKDGLVYVLSFHAYPDDFESNSIVFNQILDSFSFKY